MPNPQEIQLQRICSKPETLKRGLEIMRLALVKTRPGSGYDLATGASGLPPICAYIASQELNNGDITQKVAQSASCLNDKVFTRTLNIVRKAIADDGRPNKSIAMTYTTLTRSYTIGMVSKVVAWMDEVEKAVVLKEALPAKYDANSPLVKCAIFFWVCKILKIAQVKSAYLVEDYELSQRSFDSVIKILTKGCDAVAKKITSDVNELRKALRQKTQSASQGASQPAPPSPRKTRSAASSPSKSALKKPEDVSPSKAYALKRVVSFDKSKESDDEDMSPPETPTKKRKLDSSPIKAINRPSSSGTQALLAFEAAMSGHSDPDRASSPPTTDMNINTIPSRPDPATPRRTPRSTSQNQTKINGHELAMEVDEASDQECSASPPQPRRFRPIFFDRKQWSSRDPKISREWPAMMEHKRNMINLYGHPFGTQMPDLQIQDA